MTPRQVKANSALLTIATVGSIAEIVLGTVFLLIGGTEAGIFFLSIAAIQMSMVALAIWARRRRGVTGWSV